MKTKNKTLKIGLNLMFLVFCAPFMVAQSIITIDNNSGSLTTYQTLQDAHDNAVAGDTIYAQPSGTSYGNLSITKPLTIIGRSPWETNNVSRVGILTIGSSNVLLKGLRIIAINTSSSLQAPNSFPLENLVVNECVFTGGSGIPYSITLGHGTPSNSVGLAINNIQFKGNYLGPIRIRHNVGNILISNNLIVTGGSYGFVNETVSSVLFDNNIFKQADSSVIPLIRFSTNPDDLGSFVLNNNMFLFNVDASPFPSTIRFSNGSHVLNHNLIYNYGVGPNPILEIQGNGIITENNNLFNIDPLFTNVDPTFVNSFVGKGGYDPLLRPEDDFTLQSSSPVLNGGLSGSQIGIYNNGFEFEKLSNPKGFPLIDVTTYDTSVPKNGNINVTIQAKAN